MEASHEYYDSRICSRLDNSFVVCLKHKSLGQSRKMERNANNDGNLFFPALGETPFVGAQPDACC